MSALRIASGLLLAAAAIGAGAADAPVVRTRITPGAVVVGQPVTLAIDILVPTWFGGAIEYPPTIAIADTVAKLSDERPVNLNERIGDASYAGMTKNYVIVAQKARAFEVPAVTIRVPYVVDGRTVLAEVRTAPQRFEARLPAGAEALGYFIATPSYRLTQQLEPGRLAALKVGDALTRRITQQASDLAPMFLPALTFEAVDGLEIYPALPLLDEQGGERGSPRIGTRTDAVTYVLAKPGQYRLPGLRIGWFDPQQGVMRWAEVPQLAFDVAPAPAPAAGAAAGDAVPPHAQRPRFERLLSGWRELLAAALLLLATGLVLRWLVPATRRRLQGWRTRRAASEAAAFRRVRVAARAGDPAAVRYAATQWSALALPGVDSMILSRFVREHGDDRLALQRESLDRLLYRPAADGGDSWSAPEFMRGLATARRHWSQSRRAHRPPEHALAPLNPGGAPLRK